MTDTRSSTGSEEAKLADEMQSLGYPEFGDCLSFDAYNLILSALRATSQSVTAAQGSREPAVYRVFCTTNGATGYLYTEVLPFEPGPGVHVRRDPEPLYSGIAYTAKEPTLSDDVLNLALSEFFDKSPRNTFSDSRRVAMRKAILTAISSMSSTQRECPLCPGFSAPCGNTHCQLLSSTHDAGARK